METSKGPLSSMLGNLEAFLGQAGVLDNNWLIFSIVAACVALLWLAARAGGRLPVADALEVLEYEMELQRVPEFNRPRRLITERKYWDAMPEPFLMELATRLGESRNVIDFMVFAEGRRLHRKRLPQIAADMRPQEAVNAVSALLFQLGRKRRRDSATALSMAMLLDPDNPEIVLALASHHFTAKRYDDAMPLLETGMALCQRILDMTKGQQNMHKKAEKRVKALDSLLRKSTRMYEVCLQQ